MNRRILLGSGASLGAGLVLRSLGQEESPLDKPRYRVAVIGHTGRGNFGHGLDTLWKRIPRTSVLALADPDPKGRASARERLELPGSAAFADYGEMLAETDPDLVSVAPRHVDQHRDMILASIDAGVRGLYVEKPFCRDLAEADEIIAACEEHSVRLAVAHRNRYHPVLPVLQKEIDSGRIGRLLEIRCRGKEDSRGGGLDLWVLGSHLLNLALVFTGRPTGASATYFEDGRPVAPEDVVDGGEGVGPLAGDELHARFETTSGVPIFFDSIREAGSREAGFGLQLIGTDGIIDLRADREPLAHWRAGTPFLPASEPATWVPITSGGVGEPEPIGDIRSLVGGHVGAVEDLLESIEDGRDPLCSAEDARAVLEMTLGTFLSHREGGARVEIPLSERTHAWVGW